MLWANSLVTLSVMNIVENTASQFEPLQYYEWKRAVFVGPPSTFSLCNSGIPGSSMTSRKNYVGRESTVCFGVYRVAVIVSKEIEKNNGYYVNWLAAFYYIVGQCSDLLNHSMSTGSKPNREHRGVTKNNSGAGHAWAARLYAETVRCVSSGCGSFGKLGVFT